MMTKGDTDSNDVLQGDTGALWDGGGGKKSWEESDISSSSKKLFPVTSLFPNNLQMAW